MGDERTQTLFTQAWPLSVNDEKPVNKPVNTYASARLKKTHVYVFLDFLFRPLLWLNDTGLLLQQSV